MNDTPRTSRPKRRDDVLFRYLDDAWVIFDPLSDRLHALNLTAALVWVECDGANDVAAIADEVAGSFDPPVSRDRALHDVREAVDAFREQGLLLERH